MTSDPLTAIEARLAKATMMDSWETLQDAKYLLTRLKAAEALNEYATHGDKCIRCRFEAGEPTPDGGYRMKYAGKWYSQRPVDKTPKCTCGFGDTLTTWETAR